jgi:hypothetical protein
MAHVGVCAVTVSSCTVPVGCLQCRRGGWCTVIVRVRLVVAGACAVAARVCTVAVGFVHSRCGVCVAAFSCAMFCNLPQLRY